MMIYIAGAIILFAAFMIFWSWLNENNVATSKIVPVRTAENTSFLQNVLNREMGSVGEPLVMYAPVKAKQLENDLYRSDLPIYTVSCEERGLVVGVSGAGKTNFIFAQIAQWMTSGKSFVVTDVKPEIFGVLLANNMFEKGDYEYIVINPTDPKSHKYNMLDDVTDDNNLDELLQILVPTEAENTAAFADFARLILKSCIIHVRAVNGSVSLTSVFDYVTKFSSGQKLIDKLLDSESSDVVRLVRQAKLAGDNERFVSSGISALTNSLNFLNNKVIAENVASSDFSLNDALQSPKTAIFLQFEQKDMNVTESLYSATVQHIIRLLMTNANNRNDVFLLFDELLNGGKIENLANKFNLIRSYKMPAFLYIQSIAGLIEKYGRDEAMKIISACSLQICYRVNDVETAEFFSKLAGEVEAKKYNKSLSTAVRADGSTYNKANYTVNSEFVDLVLKETMLQMASGKALCVYKGQSAIIDIPQHWQDTPMTEKAEKVRLGDF